METKAVVLKALKKSRGRTMEEVAELVVEYLDIAADLAAAPPIKMYDSSGELLLSVGGEALSRPLTQADEVKVDLEAQSTAPPARIIPGKEDVVEYRSIDEIHNILLEHAPGTLEVAPKGFKEPLQLMRAIHLPPLKNMGTVKLSYGISMSDKGCGYIFLTTDPELNLEEALSSIRKQALNTYSSEPRKVVSKTPTPIGRENRVESDGDDVKFPDKGVQQAFRTDRSKWDKYGKS